MDAPGLTAESVRFDPASSSSTSGLDAEASNSSASPSGIAEVRTQVESHRLVADLHRLVGDHSHDLRRIVHRRHVDRDLSLVRLRPVAHHVGELVGAVVVEGWQVRHRAVVGYLCGAVLRLRDPRHAQRVAISVRVVVEDCDGQRGILGHDCRVISCLRSRGVEVYPAAGRAGMMNDESRSRNPPIDTACRCYVYVERRFCVAVQRK